MFGVLNQLPKTKQFLFHNLQFIVFHSMEMSGKIDTYHGVQPSELCSTTSVGTVPSGKFTSQPMWEKTFLFMWSKYANDCVFYKSKYCNI